MLKMLLYVAGVLLFLVLTWRDANRERPIEEAAKSFVWSASAMGIFLHTVLPEFAFSLYGLTGMLVLVLDSVIYARFLQIDLSDEKRHRAARNRVVLGCAMLFVMAVLAIVTILRHPQDAMAFTHELSRGQLIALYIINTLEVAVLIRLLLRRLGGRLLMGSVALYRFAIFSIVCYAVVLLALTIRALLLQL